MPSTRGRHARDEEAKPGARTVHAAGSFLASTRGERGSAGTGGQQAADHAYVGLGSSWRRPQDLGVGRRVDSQHRHPRACQLARFLRRQLGLVEPVGNRTFSQTRGAPVDVGSGVCATNARAATNPANTAVISLTSRFRHSNAPKATAQGTGVRRPEDLAVPWLRCDSSSADMRNAA